MVCDICGQEVDEKDIYALYPEDGSCICRSCFGQVTESPQSEQSPASP